MNDYFFSKIVLDLENRILSEVPEIKCIGQDLGQLTSSEDHSSHNIAFPAVFIEFTDSKYSNLATHHQLGEISLNIQFITETHLQMEHQLAQTKNREYLEIENKLHQALQGWSLDYFSDLSRLQIQSENKTDMGLRLRSMIYTTEYEDYIEATNQ